MSNNNKNIADVLFFGTHPDDVELYCGGTVHKLSASGKKVVIVDLSAGELGTRGSQEIRAKESAIAGKILGVSYRECLMIPDGNIENNKLNREKIIEIIRKYRPEIIFAPYPFDRHPDHINAGELIRDSNFYSGLNKIEIEDSKAYKAPKVYYYPHNYDIPVSFIFDITDSFNKKMESVFAYSTQFFNEKSSEPETFISSKAFKDVIEARAKTWGFRIGTQYGEPYFTYESLKVDEKNIFSI
ncbi:bacillithiol biosynthesis deacetylase BshB1 [soil metagenome]